MILYSSPSYNDDLLNKDFLLKIQKMEKEIQEKEEWKNVCKANSVYDTSCSLTESFISPLSFLEMGGVYDLESATQEDIKRAWSLFF